MALTPGIVATLLPPAGRAAPESAAAERVAAEGRPPPPAPARHDGETDFNQARARLDQALSSGRPFRADAPRGTYFDLKV